MQTAKIDKIEALLGLILNMMNQGRPNEIFAYISVIEEIHNDLREAREKEARPEPTL